MSSLDAIVAGWGNVFSWPGILIPVAGTLMAMVASFLPGLGNASVAVLAMVLTLQWDTTSVLLLFGALTGGATFMGSITAILFNIPGSVSSTPALLEGYPLSRRGLPRTAIACAATASALGSVFGVLVLLALLPFVEPWILKVGPLEILLIGLMGLLTIVAMPSKSILKSLCMAALGLLFAMVGSEPLQGMPRWSLGSLELGEGIGVVPMMLGIFTISELIEWMSPAVGLKPANLEAAAEQDSTLRGIRAALSHPGLVLRSSSIGTLVGMIPGIGGTVAGFVAYGHAVQSAREEERGSFGQGNIKGLIAPEAAVDAKDGGSLLPTLALGLPGSEASVILLAVFTTHGLVPGTPMLTTHLALTYTLILALLFSNLLTSVVGVLLAPALAKLKHFRIDRIALPCLLLCVLSAIQLEGRIVDLYVMLFFGLLGYYWRVQGWPRIPFVIAFVLGSVIEKNLALTTQLVDLGRIDVMASGGMIAVLFLAMIATGWVMVRRSRRPGAVKHAAAGIGLGVIATALAVAMLIVALADGQAYSTHAIGLAAAAAVLCSSAILADAWTLRERQGRRGWRRWLGDLACAPGQGPGFLLTAWMLPGTWLLGPELALGVGIFFLLRRHAVTARANVKALAAGLLSGGLLHGAIAAVGNLQLEGGWLFRLMGE